MNSTMSNLYRFEGRLKKLTWWVENVEKRMTTDLLEAKQRGPEKAVLEQVEQYQQEILKERFAKMLKSRHFPSALKKKTKKKLVCLST